MPAVAESKRNTGARVLICDDEPRLLSSLCAILEDKGFDVDGAGNGPALCRLVPQADYDVILLNMSMPGMDGLDVMSWLREHGYDTPVVIISGMSEFEALRQLIKLGVHDYIRKPYDIDELISIVGNVVSTQHRLRYQSSGTISLKLSERFFRRVIDHLPDLVFSLDRYGRITFLNDRVEDMLGFQNEDLIGSPFIDLVHEDDPAKDAFSLQRMRRLETFNNEMILQTNHSPSGLMCEVSVVYEPEGGVSADDGSIKPLLRDWYLGVAKDITERRKSQELLEIRASQDPLTGLPNRALLLDRLSLAIRQAHRNGQKMAALFVDVDDFKPVNDTFGHWAGDQLLQGIATRFKGCLREGDTLSRYGGDEFVVLLPGLDSKKNVEAVARKLIESLEKPIALINNKEAITINVSIGIALFPEDGRSATELLDRADRAMYQVKGLDGSNFCFHTPSSSVC